MRRVARSARGLEMAREGDATATRTKTKTPLVNPFLGGLAASAFSASFAEFCTIPLETVKVRLQLRGASATATATTRGRGAGMLGTMRAVAAEEGIGALWRGLAPG